MLPALPDLLQIIGGAGLLVGAIIGFMMRAKTDASMVANVVAASALGLIAGTAVAFAIWLGGVLAGGS